MFLLQKGHKNPRKVSVADSTIPIALAFGIRLALFLVSLWHSLGFIVVSRWFPIGFETGRR